MFKKKLVYDIETVNFLYDVNNQYEELQFAVGCAVDYESNDYKIYTNPSDMYYDLYHAEVIYGFNNLQFDNEFLSKYLCEYFNPSLLLHQVVDFGMHKNKTWSEVPDDYLQWMLSNNCRKKTANTLLKYKNNETFEEEKQDTFIKELLDTKSKDLFKMLKDKTEIEYPVDLGTLSKLTINRQKFEGISNKDIPQLIKDEKIEIVTKYVLQDCIITRQLFQFAEKYKYLLIPQIKKCKKYEDLVIRVNMG